jgi:integrase
MTAKKRERGQGRIGHVPDSRFLYISYYDNAGKQHRESTRSTLKSVAQEMLNQRLAAMGRGEKSPTEIKSIRYEDMRSILLNEYKRHQIASDKLETDDKGNPIGLKRTGLKLLDDFFQGRRLDRIDTDVLRAYRKKRVDTMCLEDEERVTKGEKADGQAKRLQKKREQQERTVNRDLALLRRMMTLTVQEKKLQFTLPHFPMTSEKGNARKGFVEPAKFAELLEAMPERLRPYLLFFYDETGCRPKATKQIVWEWVNLDDGMIYIPDNTTKNDEPLPLPISAQLRGLLKKLFRKNGPVFDTSNFRKAFQTAACAVALGRKVGPEDWQYEGLLPYDLRRSAIRNMKRAGVDTAVAMKISGHKTLSVFQRYNITSVDDVKDAMEVVSRYNASSMQVGGKRSK